MHILGVRLDLLTTAQLHGFIEQQLLQPGRGLSVITTVNSECLALASEDHLYRDVLNRASLNIIDGAGVTWAPMACFQQAVVALARTVKP